MNRMINNVQLTWKLARMLRAYRTYNLTIEFSKYEFYNNLLGGITFSNVKLYIYIYNLTHYEQLFHNR